MHQTSEQKIWEENLIKLKRKIDKSTITVGDFNTLLSKWTEQLDRISAKTWQSSVISWTNCIY